MADNNSPKGTRGSGLFFAPDFRGPGAGTHGGAGGLDDRVLVFAPRVP